MNTKTTLLLALVLVILASLYYAVKSWPEAEQADAIQPSRSGSFVASRDVLEEELGDIVKVVCQKKGGEEWVFEKDAETPERGPSQWRMVSPLKLKCASYEVTRFGSRLANLKYEISYAPGQPGAVTGKQAGLDPPEAVVTLTDADGKSATVEIGNKASDHETYVRLSGSDEICLGKSDLTNLVKDKPLDYRDKRFWDFKKEDVTRVEVVDRSDPDAAVSYTLSKDGSRWMFESPVTAKATSKIDEMLGAMSRMRAIEWHDSGDGKLSLYGLQPAVLTVRATIEEKIPPKEETETEPSTEAEADTEEGPKPKPEPQIKLVVYELHIADRSPIGEDTKTYLRVGDESAVATAYRSQTDKFKPVMSEWREMQITTVNVKDATRIDLTTGEGAASLRKDAKGWSFDPDGGRAEESVVTELLTALDGLEAVAFVDGDPSDPAIYGLDNPQAQLRITIPGVEAVEELAIGGYTDATTKRLVYVRRNDLASIGKVRKADIDKLLRGPHLYRDRTVIEVLPSRYERIELSTAIDGADQPTKVALEKTDGAWHMVEPVNAPVHGEQVDKLVETLGGLRAERVVAQTGEPSQFGLHAPAVTLALTYKPPAEYRIEEAKPEPSPDEPGDEQGEAAREVTTAVPVEVQPPPRTFTLSVTEHDGKIYAQRSDGPVIFEMSRDFYTQLRAEYRSDRILDFDDADVAWFSIRVGDQTHTFQRHEDRWAYEAEPDLPLDAKKVENLLVQLSDLRTDRYVVHRAEDLSSYGLVTPAREAKVVLTDGTENALWISDLKGRRGSDGGFYSAVKDRDGVFLLTQEAIQRFSVSLEELESK